MSEDDGFHLLCLRDTLCNEVVNSTFALDCENLHQFVYKVLHQFVCEVLLIVYVGNYVKACSIYNVC